MPDAPFPRLGVSTLIYAPGNILLVKRAKAPAQGLWSLPGGSVEFGETLQSAALREVFEETGLKLDDIAFIETAEAISKTYHFVIHIFVAQLTQTLSVEAGDDAADIGWFSLEEIVTLDRQMKITPGTANRLARLVASL